MLSISERKEEEKNMNIYSFVNSIPDYVSNPLTAINVMIMIFGGILIMNTKMSVNQYDLDGNYIRTFDSAYKAEKTFGKYNRAIYHCLNGDAKSAFGYLWRYEKDCPAGKKIDPICRRTPRAKAVVKYSTAGKYISRYDTIKDAVQEMPLSSSYMTAFRHIKACCERKEQYAYGFIWRYE